MVLLPCELTAGSLGSCLWLHSLGSWLDGISWDTALLPGSGSRAQSEPSGSHASRWKKLPVVLRFGLEVPAVTSASLIGQSSLQLC